MDIVDSLIEMLSENSTPVSSVFLKTKVLAHKLDAPVLKEWLTKEMNGYPLDAEVPDYRVLSGRVLVTATDGFHARWSNYPANLEHLDKDIKELITKRKIRESAASLEQTLSSTSDDFGMDMPHGLCSFLSRGLGEGVYVELAHLSISRGAVASVLGQIKSRLLDFLLDISEKFSGDLSRQDIREQSKEAGIQELFKNSVFGNNTTILMGNGNNQNVSISSSKSNFEWLTNELKKAGVSDDDITDLEKAINDDSESVDHENKRYGPKVNIWMKDMLAKAVDVSWQVDLGVASSLLATALNSYYGWF